MHKHLSRDRYWHGRHLRGYRAWCVLLCLGSVVLVGCTPDRVAVTPAFNTFDRVMLEAGNDTQLLETIWLENFNHVVLKWTLLKEQLNLTSLNNPRDVARVRTEVGVKGIVYLETSSREELGISVVDTENSAIVASVRVKAKKQESDGGTTFTSRQDLIEEAVRKLATKANSVQKDRGM